MVASLQAALNRYPILLTEGAVIERIRRETDLNLDPYVLNTALLYDRTGRGSMARIYAQYRRIASEYGLPILMAAPTWRANPERVQKAGLGTVAAVNQDAVRFMRELCGPPDDRRPPVIVGGLMACRGDAYKPMEALDSRSAEIFHRPQARGLADAGVDYIMAATLPALSEATGLSKALAPLPVPYILSFIVRENGAILDGTPLVQAIERIDAAVNPSPAFYMVNCVHPHTLATGLNAQRSGSGILRDRLLGIQANTSAKPPEDLDGASVLDSADPEPFADSLAALHRCFGLRILGGCCGTDHRHIAAVARRISASVPLPDRFGA